MHHFSIAEAMRLVPHPFDGDKRKFTEIVDAVFELYILVSMMNY
jgi:hypothetical protein